MIHSIKVFDLNFGFSIFQQIVQNVNKAQTKIRSKKDNVAGVNLPKFEVVREGSDNYELTGLSRGGQQITKCRENYKKAIMLLVELASLQTSFVTLDEVIKVRLRKFCKPHFSSNVQKYKTMYKSYTKMKPYVSSGFF